MKSILAATNAGVIAHLAEAHTLVVLDFDGTLAPIVRRRDDARMRPRTAALVRELASLYPCAIVSGRERADVAARVPTELLRAVVGNHGSEAQVAARAPAAIRRAHATLVESLSALRGVEVEDKGHSLAIHYRASRAPRDAAVAVQAHLDALRLPLRTVPGKCSVSLVPRDAPTKGDAVRAIAERLHAESTMFVGDDVTDEDAFAAPGVLGVRVGRARSSHAAYFVPSQRDVDTLLASLVRSRRSPRAFPPEAAARGQASTIGSTRARGR